MKKSTEKKLELQRKTIRLLDRGPLEQVIGGLGSRICSDTTGSDLSASCPPTGSGNC